MIKYYILSALLFLCQVHTTARDCDSLWHENVRLKTTIDLLQDSLLMQKKPAEHHLREIKINMRAGKTTDAMNGIKELRTLFPFSAQAKKTQKIENKIIKKQALAEEEAKRLNNLGYRVFQDKLTGEVDNLNYAFSGFGFGNVFSFDYCAAVDEESYETAEKDRIFLLADLSLSTKDKKAELPVIGIYQLDNGLLKRVANFRYEYAWWLGFEAMINGQYQEYHDFAYVDLIRYKLAADLDLALMKEPLFVLMRKNGRTMKWQMTEEDVENDYIVVKIMNKRKL